MTILIGCDIEKRKHTVVLIHQYLKFEALTRWNPNANPHFSFMCLNAVQCIQSCKADKPPTRRTCYKTTSQVTDKEHEVKAYFSGIESDLANALNVLYLASPAIC